MHTPTELILFAMLILAIAGWPLHGAGGLAIGRIQVTDEIDRGEHPVYVRRDSL